METEVIETTEEETESTETAVLIVQAIAIASIGYAGFRLGKLTEHLIKTGLEHRREKKAAKKNEK